MISTSYSKAWSPNDALKRAAIKGKMDLLKTALRAGAQLNHVHEQEKATTLMLAAEHGHQSVVKHLLQEGAVLDVAYNILKTLSPRSQPQDELQIIDLDSLDAKKASKPNPPNQGVPEVEEINTTTVHLSAAVAAAKAGWPDILKVLVQKYHASVATISDCNSYGEENALLACSHHGKLRCLHVALNEPGAEKSWPEALEHASFAPSLLDEKYPPSSTDLWWIPESSSWMNSLYSDNPPKRRRTQKEGASSSFPHKAELCQRYNCRELLLDALLSQGRVSECIPFIQHTWTVIMDNATIDRDTGQLQPSIKLLVAHHVLADMLERLGTKSSLLEAVNLYGKAYHISKRLFGNTEITITELGHWSACILRIKSEENTMTNQPHLTTSSIRNEGVPMLRAALTDLRTICKVEPDDARIISWTNILLPLQPGRAPFEPMSYLTAEELNPYYKSPPRNEHRTVRHSSDRSIPYPSEAALHPAYSPFLDELGIVNNILEQIHQAREDLLTNKKAETVSTQMLSEKETLMESVKKNWRCILYADSKWRKDRDIILSAVTFHGVALKCADIRFRNNEKICSIAVQNEWRAFSYCTPKIKQKKKVFKLAKKNLIEEIRSGGKKLESWRCLEFADPMLRGDIQVVEAALQQSEDAFQFVDRLVYAERTSWLKIWPAFKRQCKHRLKVCSMTTLVIVSILMLGYLLIFVALYAVIWPPTICRETNITIIDSENADGAEVVRIEYERVYPNAYICNKSLWVPAPAPEIIEVSNEDREAERKELEKIVEEEDSKLKQEQEEKARRRRVWEIDQRKKTRGRLLIHVPSPSPL